MFSKETNKEVHQNPHDFVQKLHTTLIFLHSYSDFQLQEDYSTWNWSQLKTFPFTAPDLSFAMNIMQAPNSTFLQPGWCRDGNWRLKTQFWEDLSLPGLALLSFLHVKGNKPQAFGLKTVAEISVPPTIFGTKKKISDS